jgi:predicted nucleotidyltransferase component of viral defense system
MLGLDDDEARAVAAHFAVAIEQVRRDHLISHMLAAISNACADRVIFFGGTALARTHLPEGRLSEDIDLIAIDSRAETATAIENALSSALRRSHGRITWAPALTAIRDVDAAVLRADDGQLSVRIQLLDQLGYEPWPTSMHAIEQRYRDVPAASLRVPTVAAFAAWKTVAWHDRQAPRDLYDLWALAQRGDITTEAARLFVAHGPTGKPPQPSMFRSAPSEVRWRDQLANQTRLTVTAAEALQVVAGAWAHAREGAEG